VASRLAGANHPRAGRGSPSLLFRAGGELLAVYVPVIDGKIAALYMIAAPDKLALIRRQAHPVRPSLNVDASDRTRSKDRSVQIPNDWWFRWRPVITFRAA